MFFQVLYQPKNSNVKFRIDKTEADSPFHAIDKVKSKHSMEQDKGYLGKWFTQTISK